MTRVALYACADKREFPVWFNIQLVKWTNECLIGSCSNADTNFAARIFQHGEFSLQAAHDDKLLG